MTTLEICDHERAPEHITHGSIVTYSVQYFKYLPPKKLAEVAPAFLRAVTSFNVSKGYVPGNNTVIGDNHTSNRYFILL
jgi:hypothetical protein